MAVPILLCVLALVLLNGCQSTVEKPVVPLPAPVLPPPPPAPPPVAEPVVTDLHEIIQLLQDGNTELVERSLQAMLAQPDGQNQNSYTVRLLLRQLQTEAQTLLGSEHKIITVQTGDTLSVLAQTHLGNAMLFYALARYNDIEVPRLLEKGRQLKIPLDYKSDRAGHAASTEVDQRSALERVATFLLASGATREAWQTLLQAAAKQQLSDDGWQQLFQLSQDLADAAIHDKRANEAIDTLRQARKVFPEGNYGAQLQASLTRIRSMAKLQQSADALDGKNLEAAWQLAAEAKAIDPDYPLAVDEAANLKTALIQQLHENALRHWRDRELDDAIKLWQKLLSIQGDFEPAEVYLQRARAMQDKLADKFGTDVDSA